MIVEYRRYRAHRGRLRRLVSRFETRNRQLFADAGYVLLGAWFDDLGEDGTLHYLLEWPTVGERDRAWAEFLGSDAWKAVKAETEQDGPLIEDLHWELWHPLVPVDGAGPREEQA